MNDEFVDVTPPNAATYSHLPLAKPETPTTQPMNERTPQTAAQHNAHQTGATYSTEDNWDLQKELKKLHVPTIDFVAINRFLAEREALVKERDTLREQVARANKDLTRPECPNCGGSGWFPDSEEGGVLCLCHCWSNYASNLREQVTRLREALQKLLEACPHEAEGSQRGIAAFDVRKALAETEPR